MQGCGIKFTKPNMISLCKITVVLLITLFPILGTSDRVKRSNWDSFLLAHTLDPGNPLESNFYYWTTQEWNNWLRHREPLHYLANFYRGTTLTQKPLHIVVIGTEREVERAFREPISYGYEDGYKWSNRRFQTYVMTRTFGYLSVYDCGKLYFAARMFRGRPVHFESAYLTPVYNRYVGDISYNLSRHCYRVPN